jgi:hypothetical protein
LVQLRSLTIQKGLSDTGYLVEDMGVAECLVKLLLFLGLFSGWLMLVDDLHGLLVLFGWLGLLLKMSE